MTTQFFKQK